MKNTIFILLIELIFSNVNAQNNDIPNIPIPPPNITPWVTTRELEELNSKVQFENKYGERIYSNIEGSPYFQDDFTWGTIIKNDSTIYEQIPLRYNGYEDCMEFRQKNGIVCVLANPEDYKEFKINEEKYIYRKLKLIGDKQEMSGYFKLLEEGKIRLLEKQVVILLEAVPAQPYSKPKPSRFELKPEIYFILKNDCEAFEIKTEKKIIESLGDQNGKLKKFIKQNKLKVRKEEDLMQIVAYYNSL